MDRRLPAVREYDGPLDRSTCPQIVRSALNIYYAQRARCYNQSNRAYKTYGAHGIKVVYSSKEFVDWYLKNYVEFHGSKPSVGRIDHNKNYDFENIKFESLVEGGSERITRLGNPIQKIPVVVYLYRTMEPILICESITEAAELTSCDISHIAHAINGKFDRVKAFKFKKLSDTEYNNR